MPTFSHEPKWLSRLVIDAVHADQLRAHGGLPGVRDEGALESALARPQNKWVYGDERDVAGLAAAYGFALVTSHPYRDGNKRIGFLAIVTFLGVNGCEFTGTDEDVVRAMLALADGLMSEEQLTHWVHDHVIIGS